MNKFEKIAYNCRKATLLIEKQQLGRLTIAERVELSVHLAGCSVCRIFQQQSVSINRVMSEIFKDKMKGRKLDDNFKQALQERIEKGLNKQ